MKSNKQSGTTTILVVIICLAFSLISGIMTHDIVIGGATLATGLLCAYFASEGKRSNYILGLVNYLLMSYVAFQNQLYGIFLFYTFIFAPLQIRGFFTWSKNQQSNGTVIARAFTMHNSIIITASCILGSVVVGKLLSLIPGQQLPFMDAVSSCINLCGVILMIMRFKEAWWLWLINNIADLAIWIIIAMRGGDNSIMMLLTSIGYLLINIYGIIKWNITTKKERN